MTRTVPVALALALASAAAAPAAPPEPPPVESSAYTVDISIEPAPRGQQVYVARVEFRHRGSGKLAHASVQRLRAGETAESDSSALVSPLRARVRVKVSPDGGEVAYSAELLEGITPVAARSGSLTLPAP
jgi:hypothetical protein